MITSKFKYCDKNIPIFIPKIYTHTHTHTHIYLYLYLYKHTDIYIYICMYIYTPISSYKYTQILVLKNWISFRTQKKLNYNLFAAVMLKWNKNQS